ncbi:MAG: PQQ-binding-like beta-propeller repeat protein [Acetatifactor sp.]|nr:PQQ-binding-like beta-propeller repeat protein [Acetatifactor sp.]
MEHIIELGGIVTGFHVTERHIDCMCGKELIKTDKHSHDIILKKTVFEKEGLSRKLIADDEQIFIYDFCTLYVFSQKNHTLVGKWKLGTDLSSDICGIAVDKDTIYCSIRNGKIITLDRQSYSTKEFNISDSSMWSIKTYDNHLVCGTVDGKLLYLDKTTLSIERALVLGKKNIGSLYIDGETLYAASHDGKLYKIDIRSFEVDTSMKNVHKKMFDCVGIYENRLITVSYPCSEIAFWNKDTLGKIKVINTPLKLSGRTYIENDYMYISSRNILGVDGISLIE